MGGTLTSGKPTMSQTVLYARVSTADQTAAHQKTQAEAAGFTIDQVVSDDGVSGITVPFAERPQARRLSDLLRAGDTLVVRWVDRLGRDYDDVTDTIKTLMSKGVIVRTIINNFTFDGSTQDPVQKAIRDSLIAFMAATAQAQAEATKAAQRAGIDHAKATKGDTAYRGRKPSYTRAQFTLGQALIAQGEQTTRIASACNVSRGTVHRFRTEPQKCIAALEKWER